MKRLLRLAKRCNFNPFKIWNEFVIRFCYDEEAAAIDPNYVRYINICAKFGLKS